MSKETTQKVILILLGLNVALNFVAFFILPDRISLQINTNWDIHGSTVPKIFFLFMGPIVTAGAYYYAKLSSSGAKQALLLSIIAVVGSGVTIGFNMLAQ